MSIDHSIELRVPQTSDFREGKRRVHGSAKRGEAMDLCASLSLKYVCCNVHVLRAVSNCPFDCSYCFLQNYLTNSTTFVVEDTDHLLSEVKRKTEAEPGRLFRVGTWELGDSLAITQYRNSTLDIVRGFCGIPNAVLELKTKSDVVDHLLDIEHGGRTIISWSLNTDKIVESEEGGTASLSARFEAMRKVQKAGYPIGLHFDPMIWYPGCLEDYEDLACRVSEVVSPSRVAWLSIGSLRFNPEMKRTMEINYPSSALTAAEMVVGDDNKFRYPRPIRIQLYRAMAEALRRNLGAEILTYLCMERPNVWKAVLGNVPHSHEELDYLFAESLYRRFPGILSTRPNRVNHVRQ